MFAMFRIIIRRGDWEFGTQVDGWLLPASRVFLLSAAGQMFVRSS